MARATGCDRIHPGYGFLSENGEFADACAREGLAFVLGEAIRRAGSKSAAKTLMKQAGVPVTPAPMGRWMTWRLPGLQRLLLDIRCF